MKTLWNVVSFLAVVHLLAIGMFVGWLWFSDRLNLDRMEEVRQIFSMTVEETEQARAEAEQEEALRLEEAREDARRESPPIPSDAKIRHVSLIEEIEQLSAQRLKDERLMLNEQLDAALSALREREQRFEAERRAWQESIEEELHRREDEQFAKTVRQYESIPPRQAKDMMLELIRDGRMNQAVAYLDAMNARASAKILQEFRTPDELQLATELLENLRTFGLPAGGTEEPGNAQSRNGGPAAGEPADPR